MKFYQKDISYKNLLATSNKNDFNLLKVDQFTIFTLEA